MNVYRKNPSQSKDFIVAVIVVVKSEEMIIMEMNLWDEHIPPSI